MGLRYREVAIRHAWNLLTSHELDPVALGETFNNGRKLTDNQVSKVEKHFGKIVDALKKKIDKMDAKAKGAKKTKTEVSRGALKKPTKAKIVKRK